MRPQTWRNWLKTQENGAVLPVVFVLFVFLTADATAQDRMPAPEECPWQVAAILVSGNSLHFRQEYQLYFLGLRAKYEWGKSVSGMRPYLFLFGYRAYVRANNEDHHMLRAGYRLTYDKTTGGAWFIVGGARAPVRKNLATVTCISVFFALRERGLV